VVLVQGAGDALPFADDRFELVLAGHALRHLPDERVLTALREVRRVLKPGGLFLAWDFGPTRSQALNRWHGWLLSQAEGTARLRSYRQLRTLAIEAGFDWVDQAHLRPFVFPPIPRVSIVMGKAPHGWRRTMVGGRTAVQYVPGEAEEAGEIPQRRA
jgi:SAM-dependent methyltransferase